MNREMLSHYGWIIIITLVITVMIAFATPFGWYVGDGLLYATGGFVDVSDEALSDENMANKEQKWEEKISTMQNPGVHNGTIFQGGKYKVASTGEVLKGDNRDSVPATPANGDEYQYGDYIYKYNYYDNCGSWATNTQNGWGVRVQNKGKSSYGEILSEIAGKPVNTLYYTFYNCASLTTAPTIPNSVTNMQSTFKGCTKLTTAPTIPNSVTNMYSTFNGCTSLKTAPTIPSSVTDMSYTFRYCTSLTGTITINTNPTFYGDCFGLSSTGENGQNIRLTGAANQTTLQNLANTSTSGKRIVYDINYDILRR